MLRIPDIYSGSRIRFFHPVSGSEFSHPWSRNTKIPGLFIFLSQSKGKIRSTKQMLSYKVKIVFSGGMEILPQLIFHFFQLLTFQLFQDDTCFYSNSYILEHHQRRILRDRRRGEAGRRGLTFLSLKVWSPASRRDAARQLFEIHMAVLNIVMADIGSVTTRPGQS